MLSAEENAPNLTESTEISPSSKSTRPKKPVSWLNRPESGAKLRCVISSLQHLQKHCLYSPRALRSTILDESLETGNEYGQPLVLHPLDVTPPVEAGYATQDVSALTPVQSQIVSQSAPSFQSSPPNTQRQYLSPI